MSIIDEIVSSSLVFLDSMPKEQRKKIGQFFTSKETAQFMASLLAKPKQAEVRVLDPGAGSGILSAAVAEYLAECGVREIKLTCYENDPVVLPLLKKNLEIIKTHLPTCFEYIVIEDNYITSQGESFRGEKTTEQTTQYDYVIGNPPYKKIGKDAPEALAMPEICYGAPNLYFLFAAMSLFNLDSHGEMVYIIPRSWTSGVYFRAFRKYFLSHGFLKHIHLFVSRDKVFDNESVLQETIIIKVCKEATEHVIVTSSVSNRDFNNLTEIRVPYDICVSGEEKYVYLITSEEDMELLKKFSTMDFTLPKIGIKMKTGLTVDFRTQSLLSDTQKQGYVPLFYSQHLKDGKVVFPIGHDVEYISTERNGLIQDNHNYVFCKRFTAKEEKRRLQCAIYKATEYSQYDKISTQNKINFVTGVSHPLSEEEAYGVYCLLNSTLYDRYYRILNGSTQVNSTEVNLIPVPSIDVIRDMGVKLKMSKSLTTEQCDKILEETV